MKVESQGGQSPRLEKKQPMPQASFEDLLESAGCRLTHALALARSKRHDPHNDFEAKQIADRIVLLPELGNQEQIAATKALLRRAGMFEAADSFNV
jgi:hypothetical protein